MTVILIAYYGDKWLPACLESLRTASRERLHLVLVDNAGNTTLDELSLHAFDVEVLRTPHPMGFAEANNFALVSASRLEDTVLFLNQDTISFPGWIDRCLACMADQDDLGALSPFILTYDGREWEPDFLTCVGSREALVERLQDAGPEADWIPVKQVPAPALIVRTDLLRRIGPFDTIYGSYYEDLDLCRRVRLAGYQVGLCHRAQLSHFSGSTTDNRAKELRRMRLLLRNQFIFKVREAGRSRAAALLRNVCWSFPARLAAGLLRRPASHPPRVTLEAHWDLLRVADRLLSQTVDERKWHRYLDQIGWPDRIPGSSRRPRQLEPDEADAS